MAGLGFATGVAVVAVIRRLTSADPGSREASQLEHTPVLSRLYGVLTAPRAQGVGPNKHAIEIHPP